jgi:CubicO group peptidase (beta-lactamase class C family)
VSAQSQIEAGVVALGGDRRLGVDGVHVYAHGEVLAERHWLADIRRDVFSVSKTFTSVAVGIAEAEALLTLDDPILRHLPQFAEMAAAGVEDVTVHQLLTMTSGIAYRWDDPDADHPADPAEDILGTALGADPGSRFAYRGANSYLLSRIIASCSGLDLRDYLIPRLFGPLGIANPQWSRCPLGYSLGAVGLQLRTEEVARLGRTLLADGRWQARQLVPVDYVRAMAADAVDTAGHRASRATGPHEFNARYGRHVWLCGRDEAWRMDGIYGQFSVVLPKHEACVTVTAHYQGPTTDLLDQIWTTILPALTLSSRT